LRRKGGEGKEEGGYRIRATSSLREKKRFSPTLLTSQALSEGEGGKEKKGAPKRPEILVFYFDRRVEGKRKKSIGAKRLSCSGGRKEKAFLARSL